MSEYLITIERNPVAFDFVMYVAREAGDEVLLYKPDGLMPMRVPSHASLTPEQRVEAAWHLPDGSTHAILGALARFLGAVEHPEQLRADYMAERARVDKFIAMLTAAPK